MSAFSRDYELNGEDDSVSLDDAFEFIEEGLEAEEIYMSLLIKNYNGKNIEIKITDIEKEERYKKRLAEIREELLDIALDKEK
jgi:hypothetical protein